MRTVNYQSDKRDGMALPPMAKQSTVDFLDVSIWVLERYLHREVAKFDG
ncbi:hypothetical protein [Nostoc sp.]